MDSWTPTYHIGDRVVLREGIEHEKFDVNEGMHTSLMPRCRHYAGHTVVIGDINYRYYTYTLEDDPGQHITDEMIQGLESEVCVDIPQDALFDLLSM